MKLKDIFLFESLTQEQFEKIKEISLVKKVKKGDIVFQENQSPDYLHLLLQGSAKISKLDNKGNEIIIHRLKAICLIAERANFEGITFPADCIMESDGMILKIDFKHFKEIIKETDIWFKIIKSLLEKIKLLENTIQNSLILDTETKIAKFIYENPELFETIKQHQIASLLNIKPETLSRKLKKLKETGIIQKKDSQHFIIKKREKLKELFSW